MTQLFLRRQAAVITMAILSLMCAGLLARPASAAEKKEEKVAEKAKPDIWDVKEEGRFFGIRRSPGDVGCTPSTSLVLVDLGGTFPDDVFTPDTTRLRVGGTDPTTDEGIPGKGSPRRSQPGGGSGLSTFSVIGRFP